jgi:serine/threonine protein kinase
MNGFNDSKMIATELLDRWQVGDKIDRRYEVIRIKHGGMGVVYLCYDHKDGIPLAAKTIQDRILMECTSIERSHRLARFKLEAEAWVRLEKHPNIVRASYVSEIEGKPYIFLEYVTGDEQYGVELYDWIHRGGLQIKVFRPEFLNRIDDVILFQPLDDKALRQITHNLLAGLVKMVNQQGIFLDVKEEVLDLICKYGRDPAYGARPLVRTIERLITRTISEQILTGEIAAGDRVSASVQEDKIVFVKIEEKEKMRV